jgi:sialate O-acetylesterase
MIEGGEVVVYSDKVNKPVAVCYTWADNPVCNLINSEGLPAVPFRTDKWKGIT